MHLVLPCAADHVLARIRVACLPSRNPPSLSSSYALRVVVFHNGTVLCGWSGGQDKERVRTYAGSSFSSRAGQSCEGECEHGVHHAGDDAPGAARRVDNVWQVVSERSAGKGNVQVFFVMTARSSVLSIAQSAECLAQSTCSTGRHSLLSYIQLGAAFSAYVNATSGRRRASHAGGIEP